MFKFKIMVSIFVVLILAVSAVKICKHKNRNRGIPTEIIQRRYEKLIPKLRKKQKIRVLFLVNENSKWKAQSLYDLMDKTDNFEPIIGLTIADIHVNIPLEEKQRVLQDNLEFFKKRNMNVILTYDSKNDKALDLKQFNVDIVFYQQPYSIPKIQNVDVVSKFALTCYIPYYLADYNNLPLDCEQPLHRNLFRFYVLNKDLENIYKAHLQQKGIYSDNIKGLGHTMLDRIKNTYQPNPSVKTVIYAPHWSISHEKNRNGINISTFDQTGELMLKYAKSHPEINWIFKPHPTLKTALRRIWMDEDRITKYYGAWESFATCCYDSTYLELFDKSTAMITDCGSFLLEYFCTGKPLVHLISPNCPNLPLPHSKEIWATFYDVKDINNLTSVLDDLLVKNNDYKAAERQAVLSKYNFNKNNAALNILNDLREILGMR